MRFWAVRCTRPHGSHSPPCQVSAMALGVSMAGISRAERGLSLNESTFLADGGVDVSDLEERMEPRDAAPPKKDSSAPRRLGTAKSHYMGRPPVYEGPDLALDPFTLPIRVRVRCQG